MLDSQEPYRPPQADLTAPSTPGGGGITPRMLELMKQTRPWVLLIAIAGLIMTVLIVIAGLGIGAAAAVSGESPEFAAFGLVYLLIAAVYFFPFYFLLKYAGAIKLLATGGGAPAMEEALQRQYSFWRLSGVITLVFIGLYALIFVGAIVMAVVAGMSA